MEYFVDAAYESLNHYGEELCGDKVEFVRTDDFFLAVLADGLGSGVKANILSTLTSKIIATMFANGASLTETVETIAKTLPVCSERGLAYSTFTIIRVSKDGSVFTAEFDNPSLVYFKQNELSEIPRQLIEMEGKEIYVSFFQADAGDMIITFSDGVVHEMCIRDRIKIFVFSGTLTPACSAIQAAGLPTTGALTAIFSRLITKLVTFSVSSGLRK